MIKIMIVDDHPVVRSGLEAMLSAEDDMKVVATVDGGAAALAWCGKNAKRLPDVILSDVHMPHGDGFELLGTMKNGFSSVKVILLAGMPLKIEESRAREEGAAGYLAKSMEGRSLVNAIRRIAAGCKFQAEGFVQEEGILSEKEIVVLQYASAGKTREEIAIILSISPETVKTHLKSIMRKLDTTNTTCSVARAFELGILRA